MKTHYYTQDIINICDKKHLSVDEIFEYIKKIHPEAGKSSIYRNVESLAKDWTLRKVNWVWSKAFFEKDFWDHIHLIDIKTWEIFDYENNICLPNLPSWFKATNVDLKIFWEFSK